MWLCTQHGFFSIVQKRPGEYHVRARVKEDLKNLCDVCEVKWWKIHRSAPPADYRWRLVVNEDDVTHIFCCLSAPDNLDYDNFKGRIHELPDQCEKAGAYGQLWGNLMGLQNT